ncbi:MAG: hypothetical protein JO089_04630 [Alphaproteobacteria bacterium]|nr:hypothetical protein [Alphaproteobacteria bacterium]
MSTYRNLTANAAFSAVEFAPAPDGNLTFYHVDPAKEKEARAWVASIGQELLAETKLEGHLVLVTHGERSQDELVSLMEQHGDKLELQEKKKGFNMWAGRGALSMVGQLLQLTSGFLVKGPPDGATITFALSNITANISNMVFGAEKTPDVHRLRFLKSTVNDNLLAHIEEDELPSVDDRRAPLRSEPAPPQSFGERSWDLMQRNSVRIGEIGLRYFGSLAMAFPISRWKPGLKALAEKGVSEGYLAARNPDKFTRYAGLAYVAGKTLGFASKVPDPYDPDPNHHTKIDEIREKYVFRTSTLIEAAAATMIAGDRFLNRKIKFPDKAMVPGGLRGRETKDFLGGVGGLLFVGAFAMRFFAPFGVKKVDMAELEAHITDALAKTPPEKIPQLMADNAAMLKEHFKDQPIEFGELFTTMMTDLYRYHRKGLADFSLPANTRGSAPATGETPQNGDIVPAPQVEAHTLDQGRRGKEGLLAATSRADTVASQKNDSARDPQLSMGA